MSASLAMLAAIFWLNARPLESVRRTADLIFPRAKVSHLDTILDTFAVINAPWRHRTPVTMQVTGVRSGWAHQDLNLGPLRYQRSALTT